MLLILFFNIETNAQNANVIGKIILRPYKSYEEKTPINIIIENKSYRDTLSIVFADSIMSFNFKNIPKGTYNIKVNNDLGENPFESYLITDVEVNRDTIILYPLSIYSSDINFFYDYTYQIKTDNKILKEYYKNGALYGQGYFLRDTVLYSDSTNRIVYKKIGKWKYYYENGKMSAICSFKEDGSEIFSGFYENGNIKVKGYFSSSMKKPWKYFSKEGKLLVELEFISPIHKKIKNKYLENYMKNIYCFSEIPFYSIAGNIQHR